MYRVSTVLANPAPTPMIALPRTMTSNDVEKMVTAIPKMRPMALTTNVLSLPQESAMRYAKSAPGMLKKLIAPTIISTSKSLSSMPPPTSCSRWRIDEAIPASNPQLAAHSAAKKQAV